MRLIALFVNKVDKLEGWGDKHTADTIRSLPSVKVIDDDLCDRCGKHIQYRFFAGSALEGWGITGSDGLKNKLEVISSDLGRENAS